jgi:hypothetical protein
LPVAFTVTIYYTIYYMNEDDNIIPFERLADGIEIETGNSGPVTPLTLAPLHKRMRQVLSVLKEIQWIATEYEEGTVDDPEIPAMYEAALGRIEVALYIAGPDAEDPDV